MPESETHRYGIVDPSLHEGRRYQVKLKLCRKAGQGNSTFQFDYHGQIYPYTGDLYVS